MEHIIAQNFFTLWVRPRSAQGTITLRSRYAHAQLKVGRAQLKVRSRSTQVRSH